VVNIKVKFHRRTNQEAQEGRVDVSSTLPLAAMLDECGWFTPRPGRFTRGKDAVYKVKEAGWVQEPVLMSTENLSPVWIRSSDRPARSKSLYRLSYLSQRAVGQFDFNWIRVLVNKEVNSCCR
jgi:hypothetical protein